MEKQKLIPMKDFVYQLGITKTYEYPEIDWYQEEVLKLEKIRRYADFLNKPLSLSLFIPCNDKGDVLESLNVNCLKGNGICQCGEEQVLDCRDWIREHDNANKKILFNGFSLCDRNEKIDCIVYKNQHLSIKSFEKMKIDDLTKYDFELTENATKLF